MIGKRILAALCLTVSVASCGGEPGEARQPEATHAAATRATQEANIPDDLYLAFTISGGEMDGTRVVLRDWPEMGHRNVSFLSGRELKLQGKWQDWQVTLTTTLPEPAEGTYRYKVEDAVRNANNDLNLRFFRRRNAGESESFDLIARDASLQLEHYGEIGDLAAGRFSGQFVYSENSGIDLIGKSEDQLRFATVADGVFRVNRGTRDEFDQVRQRRPTGQ